MRCPIFLPQKFAYCREISSIKEVFASLAAKSSDFAVEFFEIAAEDETWIKESGHELMHLLLRWFNAEFIKRKLSLTNAQRVAIKVQEHYPALKNCLDLDIAFIVNQNPMHGSSLLFGAFNEFFRDLIWKEFSVHNQFAIPLRISLVQFQRIQEFINTGTIQALWKEDSNFTLDLLYTASELRMVPLVTFVGATFKRYINGTNISYYLTLSKEKKIPILFHLCTKVINEQGWGLEIEIMESGYVKVELSRFTQSGNEILDQIYPLITHLVCRTAAAQDDSFVRLIKKAKLLSLDLKDSPGLHEELIDAFPDVSELNLSSCIWLNDSILLHILAKARKIASLKIADNEQLSFQSWGNLSLQKGLSFLDISRLPQLGNQELDFIAVICSLMVELDLEQCFEVSDGGILSLSKHCRRLKRLNVSKCKKITESGFINLAISGLPLTHLQVLDCPGITDVALLEISKFMPSLIKIEAMHCPVSQNAIEEILKFHPKLEILS